MATVIVAGIGVSLGQWQTGRAQYKQAIEQQMQDRKAQAAMTLTGSVNDVEQVEYRRVQLKGTFDPRWVLYLENRVYKSVAGFYVLMPMQIAGSSESVMVMRGWAPRDPADRSKVPVVPTPAGEVVLEGVIRRGAGQVMQLGDAPQPVPGSILQNLVIADAAAASGKQLVPFVIEQDSPMEDGLVRDWPMPSAGIDTHRGYAFQWYGLALMAGVFFIVTGLRRGKP